jgi:hypothetical protein
VSRNQAGSSWISKAIVYSLTAALAGLTAGALLGIAGDLLPLDLRLAVGSVLAVVAIILGVLELFGRRINPPQFDCETPQHWVHKGPLRWATRNGLTLGLGATSRIGFLLWYVVPIGALLFGSPILGATIYGTYGLIRGVAAPLILLGTPRLKTDVSDWSVMHSKAARVPVAGQLVLTGVAVAIAVGL